jgi:muconolactone delta-isomerase
MEYLLTMTTHVPDGTPETAVEDIRVREAAHSRELAAQRHLLRLWRPPLQPGEWRSLGLFAAGDSAGLETVLASMPLRVWRTDEVTPLSPHPNDPPPETRVPGPSAAAGDEAAEFLTMFTLTFPEGTPGGAVAGAREADRARELAGQGHLVRLAAAGPGAHAGPVAGARQPGMQAILASLPLDAWMTAQTTPLTRHPATRGQPGLTGGLTRPGGPRGESDG